MSHVAETPDTPAGMPNWVRSLGWALARIAPVAGLLIAWELFAQSGRVTMFVLPPFSAVAARIWEDALGGDLWINIGGTLYRTFAGFILGSIAGVLIAIGIARSRIAHWFFDPLISIGFPMPKVAFLPVVILWLGVFDISKIAMVTIEVLFPVVTATVAGISGVSHELIWSARNMGAKDRQLLTQIILPAALPQIFTGLQVAMPIAMIVAVFTEMALGGYGLGAAMNSASKFADSRGVYAGIVEIAVVGYLVVVAMAMLRRRLLIWHQEAQAPSTV
jgi:ABC-type nitrate/sulfonate/bicarbonate transport system permease component